jgi:hypothetical protein
MKQKQKRIVFGLVAANVVVILGLLLWVSLAMNAGSSSAPTSTQSRIPASPAASPGKSTSAPTGSVSAQATLTATSSLEMCQWKAAHLLARAELDGAVTLAPDGSLRFNVTYSLTPDRAVDEAAQSIWLAFDIALALLEDGCDLFTQVEVLVLAQGNQTVTHISARVDTVDLVAFDAGELSEDEFIQRVTYQISDK